MAKQRPQSRPKGPSPSTAHQQVATPSLDADSSQTIATAKLAAASQESGKQPRRSTYVEAVALYEQGLEALQRHDYRRAEELLESVLVRFPEEKELHERVRLYVSICQRQAAPREPAPASVDERLYASTLAINGGRYDEAISHLRLVRDEDPDNDYALYMLAVAHAQRGEHAEALAHLERSITLNPENRALARRDPDLEMLRNDEAFRATLETAASRAADRRRHIRPKSGR
jgi:outer membrane protein assembly factor BamD (BamD/ComL family)